jgi:RNA polymerase sigma-70 factor (ECF subfamily)
MAEEVLAYRDVANQSSVTLVRKRQRSGADDQPIWPEVPQAERDALETGTLMSRRHSEPNERDEAFQRTLTELFPLIYPTLRRRAETCMKGEAPGHTLQATALVHEVYLKLAKGPRRYNDENHLYAVVATIMRQILVDHARARATRKRGGRIPKVPLDNACQLADQHSALFLDIQDAVAELHAKDPLRARMFDLDFLVGLTNREIADALGIAEAKVKYGLSVARAWLRQSLTAPSADEKSSEE